MTTILQPPGWAKPKGYSNGIATRGRLIFLGGQIGWDAQERPAGPDFASQFEQTLTNIKTLLGEAEAGPEHLVRLTWFLTDRSAYLSDLKRVGAIYRAVIGPHWPTMSVVEVKSLMEPWALVEIEATAVIPD